jgi:hypothetical protein
MVNQPGDNVVVGAVYSAPTTGPIPAATISGITSDAAVVELTTSIDVLTEISDKWEQAADVNQQNQSNPRKEASSAMPKTRTRTPSSNYRVRIRGVRRARPDASKIARAVIELALAEAAREAAAEAEAQAAGERRVRALGRVAVADAERRAA